MMRIPGSPFPIRLVSVLLVALVVVPNAWGQTPAPSEVEMPSFDGAALEPATLSYEVERSRNQNTSTGSMRIEISEASRDGTAAWRIAMKGAAGGDPKSELYLDRSSLLPLTFRTTGGTFDLRYDGSTVTGSVGKGANATSIDTTVSGPVLDEKSLNMQMGLAGLALSEGDTYRLRTFSPLGPSVHVVECRVTGTTTVEVPAGSFDAYVVSITPLNKQTEESGTMYLRTTAPHYLVKGTITIKTGTMTVTSTRTLTSMQ